LIFFLAFIEFFFITTAINGEIYGCIGGPCSSFAGYEEILGVTTSWGGSFGWYCCILGTIWTCIISCCACICCRPRRVPNTQMIYVQSEQTPLYRQEVPQVVNINLSSTEVSSNSTEHYGNMNPQYTAQPYQAYNVQPSYAAPPTTQSNYQAPPLYNPSYGKVDYE